MNILILGASGFTGSEITNVLLHAGHTVTACVRDVGYAKKMFPLCKVIHADFCIDTELDTWLPRLENMDVVINTVGIIYHPDKQVIWQVHFDTPKIIFDACVLAGVKKVIHISALGVDKYKMDYAESKLAADQYLANLPILSIILRPSLIYAKNSYGGSSLFRGLPGLPFIIPVPGNGQQSFQPIYLPDLAIGIAKLIEDEQSENIILDAVCHQHINLVDLLGTMRSWLAIPDAMVLKIPTVLIKVISSIGDLIPYSTINSISHHMLMKNSVTTTAETEKFRTAIGFEPRNFAEGLFTYPSGVQDRWQAKLFFVKPLLQMTLAFLWIFTAICSAFIFPHAASFTLLTQVGISGAWQPLALYLACAVNFLLGSALLFNYQTAKICILQIIIICIYTSIITVALPYLWFEPFGPISKNVPLLVAIYVLYVLENHR